MDIGLQSVRPSVLRVRCLPEEQPLIPPIDPRLLRHLFSRWEPERPELLVRLRPRRQE